MISSHSSHFAHSPCMRLGRSPGSSVWEGRVILGSCLRLNQAMWAAPVVPPGAPVNARAVAQCVTGCAEGAAGFPTTFRPARPAGRGSAGSVPTTDDGTRDDVMLGQNMISCTHFEPDFDALRAATTRIIVAAGQESEGEMAHRGAVAVAARLGEKPVVFPSNHGGFLGGEYGQTGKPAEFATTLREVLGG